MGFGEFNNKFPYYHPHPTVASAVPLPIPTAGIYSIFQGEEAFPGQRQRLMLSSVGVRTERAPSGEQRIRRLAREFNAAHGIEKQGEFFESAYQPLDSALGTARAPQALQDLIAVKMRNDFTSFTEAKEMIKKRYEQNPNAPLTGSKERERVFKRSLNPEQLQRYNDIKAQRQRDLHEVQKLLSTVQQMK